MVFFIKKEHIFELETEAAVFCKKSISYTGANNLNTPTINIL